MFYSNSDTVDILIFFYTMILSLPPIASTVLFLFLIMMIKGNEMTPHMVANTLATQRDPFSKNYGLGYSSVVDHMPSM
jgi:hypothetical protein